MHLELKEADNELILYTFWIMVNYLYIFPVTEILINYEYSDSCGKMLLLRG